MIDILVISSLVAALFRNQDLEQRAIVCAIVLWITGMSYFMFHYGPYDQAIELLGYYQYQSAILLISISALYFVPGKLSTVLTAFFCVCILINGGAWWYEGHQILDESYQSVVWVLFAIQLSIMFSRSLTNGIYRAILRTNMARDPAEIGSIAEHRTASNLDDMVKAPK